jgi:hypothetical protein
MAQSELAWVRLPTDLLRTVDRALALADQLALRQAMGVTPRQLLRGAAQHKEPFRSRRFGRICCALDAVRARGVVGSLQALERACVRALVAAWGDGALLEHTLNNALNATLVAGGKSHAHVTHRVAVPVRADDRFHATEADFSKWVQPSNVQHAAISPGDVERKDIRVHTFRDLRSGNPHGPLDNWLSSACFAAGVREPLFTFMTEARALCARLESATLIVRDGVVRDVVFVARVEWERVPTCESV